MFVWLEFPARFRTEEIPSLGTVEIYENKTWENLCTATWGDVEESLTCMAMGYLYNGSNDNNTWHKDTNTTKTTTHHNCTSLTHSCENKSKEILQSYEGIKCIGFLQLDVSYLYRLLNVNCSISFLFPSFHTLSWTSKITSESSLLH